MISAGRPLADTPVGAYLRLVGDVAFRDASPLSVLALLKHPLAAGGEPIGLFREALRRLERQVLRGPAPEAGLAGLKAALAASGAGPSLGRWLDKVAAILGPFVDAVRARRTSRRPSCCGCTSNAPKRWRRPMPSPAPPGCGAPRTARRRRPWPRSCWPASTASRRSPALTGPACSRR